MNEVLAIAEIYERFPSEWVLLDKPQLDKHLGVQGGTVVCHSKDRDEVHRKALELPVPRHLAVLYTGPVPAPGTKVLLTSFAVTL
jgi:hypothetical protein